jgi:hypothetical protein
LARFVTSDGRTVVDTIRLSLTGTGRDGHWYRIKHDGFFYAEVRTCAELGRLVNLADLREVLAESVVLAADLIVVIVRRVGQIPEQVSGAALNPVHP